MNGVCMNATKYRAPIASVVLAVHIMSGLSCMQTPNPEFIGMKLSFSRADEERYLAAVMDASLVRYAGIDVPMIDNISIVTEGSRSALCLRLIPGQPLKNNGIRAEIAVDYPFAAGATVNYQWCFKIGADFRSDAPKNRWWVMGQWHDQPDAARGETWNGFPANSPPILLGYGFTNGTHALGLSYGSPNSTAIGYFPVIPDTWMTIRAVIHWALDASGSIVITTNGATALTANGRNMHNAYQHYLKLGQYRQRDIQSDNRVYIDDLVIY